MSPLEALEKDTCAIGSRPELTEAQVVAFLAELGALTRRHKIAIGSDYDGNVRLVPVNGSDLRYERDRNIQDDECIELVGEEPFPPTAEDVARFSAGLERRRAVIAAKIAAGYTWDDRHNAWRDKDGSL